MPAQYPLPNWIQPADEAGNLARGIQLGESQARQRLLEKQQQFQEQQAAVDQARADMEFKLRSEAQARKFAGQQKFQQLIAGGMDPASALLQVAPLVNESLTGAAQLYKATQPPPPKVFDVAGGLYRAGQTGPVEKLVEAPSKMPRWVPPDPTTGAPGYFASTSGGVHIPPTPKTPLAPDKQVDDESLKSELNTINSQLKAGPSAKREKELMAERDEVNAKRKALRGVIVPPKKPTTPDEKLAAAKALRAQHPDWTKQQILDTVNQ